MSGWGFALQKPLKKACKQPPAKVQKWLDEEYPAIKNMAKKEGAEIYRPDEYTVTDWVSETFNQRCEIKVILMLDNLRVHQAILVRAWLEKRVDKIELFYLPAYSPELNPDEYLNCDLKADVHSKLPAWNKIQLIAKVLWHMRMLLNKLHRVKKYFKHPK